MHLLIYLIVLKSNVIFMLILKIEKVNNEVMNFRVNDLIKIDIGLHYCTMLVICYCRKNREKRKIIKNITF